MKPIHNLLLILLALATAPNVFAQANQVPGPGDYNRFSQFITDRNIFDPSREPHYTGTRTRSRTPRVRSASAPFLALVGIMSYNKGTFAFFNGNDGSDSNLRQILTVSGKISDYTVTSLTEREVTLQSDDKKQTMTLKVGDVLRKDSGKWRLPNADDAPVDTSTANTAQPAGDSSAAPAEATPPASDSAPNDVLKRLMQLREKENQ